jgi:hypothetical protein
MLDPVDCNFSTVPFFTEQWLWWMIIMQIIYILGIRNEKCSRSGCWLLLREEEEPNVWIVSSHLWSTHKISNNTLYYFSLHALEWLHLLQMHGGVVEGKGISAFLNINQPSSCRFHGFSIQHFFGLRIICPSMHCACGTLDNVVKMMAIRLPRT